MERAKFTEESVSSNYNTRPAGRLFVTDGGDDSQLYEPEPSGESFNGVPDHCVDKSAHLDKVVLAVKGTRRKLTSKFVQVSCNLPIAGPGRHYARSMHGHCKHSLEPFELRYGLLQKHFLHCPAFLLGARTEWTTLTCSKLMLLQNGLFRKGSESYPTNVELTFDITGCSLGHFKSVCRCVARTRKSVSSKTGRTIYYGSPRSAWQLRVYERLPALRVEFIFRLPFLRQYKIRTPYDICKLARINLRKLIRLSDPLLTTKLLRMQTLLFW